MLVFAVVAVKLGPDWGKVGAGFVPHISHTSRMLYAYFVVGILGTAMTPYEVYFYSSGGIEDQWSPKDLGLNRANAILGYGLGGTLSFALMITGGALFVSHGISPEHLGTVALAAEQPPHLVGQELQHDVRAGRRHAAIHVVPIDIGVAPQVLAIDHDLEAPGSQHAVA